MNNSKREAFSNQELDQMAAEKMGLHLYSWKTSEGLQFAKDGVWGPRTWNPTDPESNQAERYLFPKLLEQWGHIDIEHTTPEDSATFTMVLSRGYGDSEEIILQDCEDPDQINRTKVICFLEAMEKTNE